MDPKELRLLESLRRQERLWRRTRWVLLANVLIAGLGSYLCAHLVYLAWLDLPSADNREAKGLILLCFMSFMLGVMALFSFAMLFRRHPFHAMRRLVLKLAESENGGGESTLPPERSRQ